MVRKIITSSFLLALFVMYFITAVLQAPPVIKGALSESFFPMVIGIIAIPMCIATLVSAIQEKRQSDHEQTVKEAVDHDRSQMVKPVLICILIFLFVLLFERLGFLICAPVFVFLFMLIYDDKREKIPKKVLIALIITAVAYVLYEKIFGIHFPELWR